MLAALVGAAAPAFAAGDDAGSAPPPAWLRFVDNEFYKISVNIRGRFEYANREDLDASQAWTVRTRAGIETKPFHGFTGLAELENSFTFDKSTYWDTVTPSNGKTSIADPPNTELNRGWLRYQNADWWDLDVKGGRQWINLDDQRWIGTVGWRQNDQTYDAARIGSSFGVEQLEATYAYVWEVNRIFGDQGPPDKRDFNSQTNLLHVRYGGIPGGASLVGFVYLLDFDNSPANSSNSYGLRLTGSTAVTDDVTFAYVASYAYQTDAGRNPVDYAASYANAEATLGFASVGAFRLGYELLGSDGGVQQLTTPLATAHKFNGFADVFLDNGGPRGLQDLYVSVGPRLPWELKGQVIYHHFWSANGGIEVGDEVDFVLKRAFGPHVTVLAKGGYFFGTSSAPPDTWRTWLEVTFAY